MKTINQEKLAVLRDTAKRTFKILGYIEEGLTPQTIVQKVGCNRQLVDYYFATLTQKR